MASPFKLYTPQNLTFQDYLSISQCARMWCDGYDFKSYPRLISTLAHEVTVDYADVNSSWGCKTYHKEEFAKLWLSEEHLGLTKLKTQHLLGLPYFSYIGPSRTAHDYNTVSTESDEVEEVEVSWQILASHGRLAESDSTEQHPRIGETSDHRAVITHVYVKVEGTWKITLLKPQPIYMVGDFERVRRAADLP